MSLKRNSLFLLYDFYVYIECQTVIHKVLQFIFLRPGWLLFKTENKMRCNIMCFLLTFKVKYDKYFYGEYFIIYCINVQIPYII